MDLMNTGVVFFILAVGLSCGDLYVPNLPPPCSSNIYCHGDLLHTIQMAEIFHDSKEFVDMKLRRPPNETLSAFEEFMQRKQSHPSRRDVEKFVQDNFEPAGSEFEDWDPSDWKDQPKFLRSIIDPNFRKWAKDLHDLWKFLGRKMKDDVKENQDLYSIIYVPHPVIVPGGRFREFYYWDSYWIVRGLLLSEMYTTVKGMMSNFLSIVENYGLIPNGGRIYYAMRSQPPLLIPMIKSYLDAVPDRDFLKNSIDIMEKEFQFWITNHTVEVEKDGKKYMLARYKDGSSGPRPESYREDYLSAENFRTVEEKENYYSELKAAAESGWDFSSRWFIVNATNKGSLIDLKTRYIIPVDLNAILYWNAKLLSGFYKELDMPEKSSKYRDIAEKWLDAVTAVLWHDEVGTWLDYDIMNDVKRDYFYPTNISPLWTGCYDERIQIAKITKYLEKTRITLHLGGIPTTIEHTGEQWDFPNAWPPLQYIMIKALDNINDAWANELAFELSEKWVRSNYKAYNETSAMYEKYDATVPGGHGGGGEYEVQLGFGWSNGVILELLDRYSDKLTLKDSFSEEAVPLENVAAATSLSSVGQVVTTILVLLGTFFTAGCIG
ncbi:Trehalase [Blattella germanica]|nr:Trehalase [Blattella germanica]